MITLMFIVKEQRQNSAINNKNTHSNNDDKNITLALTLDSATALSPSSIDSE